MTMTDLILFFNHTVLIFLHVFRLLCLPLSAPLATAFNLAVQNSYSISKHNTPTAFCPSLLRSVSRLVRQSGQDSSGCHGSDTWTACRWRRFCKTHKHNASPPERGSEWWQRGSCEFLRAGQLASIAVLFIYLCVFHCCVDLIITCVSS